MTEKEENYDFFNPKLEMNSPNEKKKVFLFSTKLNKILENLGRFKNENAGWPGMFFLFAMISIFVGVTFIFVASVMDNYKKLQFYKIEKINKYLAVANNDESFQFNLSSLRTYVKNENLIANKNENFYTYLKENNSLLVNLKMKQSMCALTAREIYKNDALTKLNYININGQKINRDMVMGEDEANNLCSLENNDVGLNYIAIKK